MFNLTAVLHIHHCVLSTMLTNEKIELEGELILEQSKLISLNGWIISSNGLPLRMGIFTTI